MFLGKLLIAAGIALAIFSTPVSAVDTELSQVEVDDLTFMREEEKLARDVYVELYQHFKDRDVEMMILANIAVSEQKHMDAMLEQLDKYQLEDPAVDLAPGEFDNGTLAALYQNLVSDNEKNVPVLSEPAAGGKVSPMAALRVGAWIEERDMIDIMHAIANTNRADIVGVYTNLLCGSREHLRAFVKHIGADVYQPQILHSTAGRGGEVNPMETLDYWLGDASDAICM